MKKAGLLLVLIMSVVMLPSCNNSNNNGKDREVTLYAMNDFHGAAVYNKSSSELGILKQGTFFKQKGKEKNTLILNSGDMWQGSIESNLNYGQFLTEVMNTVEFDCFTLGNHEFDWGAEYITKNMNLKDSDTNYQTPFLASNIYHFDRENLIVKDHADELGQEYVVKNLENGLKVGIIGIIGTNQITSITSGFVDSYVFLDPESIITRLSDKLRTEENVDVVVVDAHSSADEMLAECVGITNISNKSNKRYVDAVFCAHSHQYEATEYNGVPFVQSGCNGRGYSEISLSVDKDGEVSLVTNDNHRSNTSEIRNITSYDSKIESLYEKYSSETKDIGCKVLANINGSLSQSDYSGDGTKAILPNLVSKAIALEAISQGYEIDLAMCNKSRSSIGPGTITYSDLYKALPFNNEIYVINAKGSDIINEAQYNSICCINPDLIESNKYYKVAVIDYLATHRNVFRIYDYFTDFEILGKLTKEGSEFYNYRDITADYLLKQEGTINASDYTTKGQFVLNYVQE